MRYARPQVEEMGQANNLVAVLYTGGPDIEPSTEKVQYCDPWEGD